MTLILSCGYGSIRFTNIVPMPDYMLFPLVIVGGTLAAFMFTGAAGQFYVSSSQLIRSWKNLLFSSKIISRYYRQKVKSLSPVKTHVGIGGFSLFYVKKSTLLTFYFKTCIHLTDALLLL